MGALARFLLAALAAAAAGWAQAQLSIDTYAGGGPDDMPARAASVAFPSALTFDAQGNLYVASYGRSQVYKVDPAGTLDLVAGNGIRGEGGDGGPATQARFDFPFGLAVNAAGDLYISDSRNNRVRKVDAASGSISTVAGGDGSLASPLGLALDAAGNLYIADSGRNRVVRLDTQGTMSVVAGDGEPGYRGDGGPAAAARLNAPTSVAVDAAGRLFIADFRNHRVRVVDPAGNIYTVAGTGAPGSGGDGGPATAAALDLPHGVAVDAAGSLYVGEYGGNRVRRVDPQGIIHTLAGSGGFGYAGDGGPAPAALLNVIYGIAVDPFGQVHIGDSNNHRVRRVAAGAIETVAGNGTYGYSGEQVPATKASVHEPRGLAASAAGELYIADYRNARVRRIDALGRISTVAGSGGWQYAGDGLPATQAGLAPTAVALDAAGNLYVADIDNHRVRRIDAAGVITTVAGAGIQGYGGDGGPAAAALLAAPSGVAVDAAGNLYIADSVNLRVRRVNPQGIITTVAGNGTYGYSGDGGPATAATMTYPGGLAVDAAGNLYITDTNNQRIRRLDAATGTIATVAGDGNAGYSGDGGPAVAASLNYPADVALDASGNLYITDRSNLRVRRVDPQGRIATVAGTGTFGYDGDGGEATAASLGFPNGVAAGPLGEVYFSDDYHDRVRRLHANAAALGALSGRIFLAGAAARGDLMLDLRFALGGASNGVDPLTEAVILQIGPHTLTVPAGALARDPLGRLVYGGPASEGTPLELVLTPREDGSYGLRLRAAGIDLATLAGSSVPVTLVVGDDRSAPQLVEIVPRAAQGRAHLLWRQPASGENLYWRMGGAQVADVVALPVVAPGWEIAGSGDLAGDARTGIVWRHAQTGQNAVWLVGEGSLAEAAYLPTVADPAWRIVGVADYDGDGKSDLLWRRSTGENALWRMNGAAMAEGRLLPTVADPGWQVAGSADMDGDGKADVLWRHAVTGENALWLMEGLALRSGAPLPAVPDPAWAVAGVGDFDGDGKADLLWRHGGTGQNAVWRMSGAALLEAQLLPAVEDALWTVGPVRDFDGDGKADIAWRQRETGVAALWLMNGFALRAGQLLPMDDPGWTMQ